MQQRMLLNSWNTLEQVCLASAVSSLGDNDWNAVSKLMNSKFPLIERPLTWFSPETCEAQYKALIDKYVRMEISCEKPVNQILQYLKQVAKQESQSISEQHKNYLESKDRIEKFFKNEFDMDMASVFYEDALKKAKEREENVRKFQEGIRPNPRKVDPFKPSTTTSPIKSDKTETTPLSTSPLLSSLLNNPPAAQYRPTLSTSSFIPSKSVPGSTRTLQEKAQTSTSDSNYKSNYINDSSNVLTSYITSPSAARRLEFPENSVLPSHKSCDVDSTVKENSKLAESSVDSLNMIPGTDEYLPDSDIPQDVLMQVLDNLSGNKMLDKVLEELTSDSVAIKKEQIAAETAVIPDQESFLVSDICQEKDILAVEDTNTNYRTTSEVSVENVFDSSQALNNSIELPSLTSEKQIEDPQQVVEEILDEKSTTSTDIGSKSRRSSDEDKEDTEENESKSVEDVKSNSGNLCETAATEVITIDSENSKDPEISDILLKIKSEHVISEKSVSNLHLAGKSGLLQKMDSPKKRRPSATEFSPSSNSEPVAREKRPDRSARPLINISSCVSTIPAPAEKPDASIYDFKEPEPIEEMLRSKDIGRKAADDKVFSRDRLSRSVVGIPPTVDVVKKEVDGSEKEEKNGSVVAAAAKSDTIADISFQDDDDFKPLVMSKNVRIYSRRKKSTVSETTENDLSLEEFKNSDSDMSQTVNLDDLSTISNEPPNEHLLQAKEESIEESIDIENLITPVRANKKDDIKSHDLKSSKSKSNKSSKKGIGSKSKDGSRVLDNKKRTLLLVHQSLNTQRYSNTFQKPITNKTVPGYEDVIYCPMDLQTIRKKLDSRSVTVTEFQRDVLLMINNAKMYNNINSQIYNIACEVQKDALHDMALAVQNLDEGVFLASQEVEDRARKRPSGDYFRREAILRKRSSRPSQIKDESGEVKRIKMEDDDSIISQS